MSETELSTVQGSRAESMRTASPAGARYREQRGSWQEELEPETAAWLPARPDRGERIAQLLPTSQRLHEALQADPAITETTYHIWLKPLQLLDADHGHLYIGAPLHLCTWVQERFTRLLERHATALASRPIEVRIGILEDSDV